MSSTRWKKSLSLAAGLAAGVLSLSPAQAQNAAKDITVVLSDEPAILDSCRANLSLTGRVIRHNVVESLTEIDPKDGTVRPELALSWERVNDLTWRFKLRPNVKFHDGAPLNAETVTAAITRTLNPTFDCETRTKYFTSFKISAKPVDDMTVDIISDAPVPILPTYMGLVMIDSPNEPRDKLTREPIGTGPYKFVKWNAGTDILLTRFDGWWNGKPQVENVRYIWRAESAVRAAMVKLGEADIAPAIAVTDANEPKMDFGYLNSETASLRIDALTAPLNDRRVRLALNYAADLNSLRGTVFSKDVIRATQMVVPSILGHDNALDKEAFPYDPAKAKQLIAEAKAAGVPVDKEILLYGRSNIYPNDTEVMEAFHSWYSAIGLNVKVRMLAFEDWFKVYNKPYAEDRPPSLVQASHDNNNGDAAFTVFYKYGCKGATSVVCDPALDQRIADASALTGEPRIKAWQNIFREVYLDRVVDVEMFHLIGYSRVGSRINFTPTIATNTEIQISQVTFK